MGDFLTELMGEGRFRTEDCKRLKRETGEVFDGINGIFAKLTDGSYRADRSDEVTEIVAVRGR